MNVLKQLFSDKKVWVALVALVGGIAVALGVSESLVTTISGSVLSALSVVMLALMGVKTAKAAKTAKTDTAAGDTPASADEAQSPDETDGQG